MSKLVEDRKMEVANHIQKDIRLMHGTGLEAFKTDRQIPKKSFIESAVTDKVGMSASLQVKEFEPNYEHVTNRKGLQHTKWTRYEQNFRLKDRDARLMDSLPPALESNQDSAPLFSSFS